MKARSSRTFKTLLIDPFKQIKLGAYVVFLSIGFVLLTAALFIKAFWEQYQQIIEIFQITSAEMRSELITNELFLRNGLLLGLLLLGFIVSLMFLVFRFTHKYYGPLVSIQRFVDNVSQGDYSKRVVIRKGDELHELVESLNKMADYLEQKHGSSNKKSSTNSEKIPS